MLLAPAEVVRNTSIVAVGNSEEHGFFIWKWILETYPFPAKPGLDRIRKVLSQLGDPHKHLKFVHVAGTNGKGSTACYINNILISAGFKTGLYTSPGIRSINDRIKINNKNIPDKEAALISVQLKKLYINW